MSENIPWDILIKKFRGEVSLEEEKSLSSWVMTHEEVYATLHTLWDSIQQEGETFESDADRLWIELKRRIDKNSKEIRIPLNRFRWISAAASILLIFIFSFTGYITKQWYDTCTIDRSYTALNGKSKIMLPDGSVVWLNKESSLEYKTTIWNRKRFVYLTGEAYFEVVKDDSRPFIVKNQDFKVIVHGTVFNMFARNTGKKHVSLLSGSVSVTSGKEEYLLSPGEVAILDKSGKIKVEKKDVYFDTMWTQESVRFEQKTLKELARYLTRWYGVKVIVDSSITDDQAYTFTIKNEPLEEILRLMARIHPITYSFDENDKVTIRLNPLKKEGK